MLDECDDEALEQIDIVIIEVIHEIEVDVDEHKHHDDAHNQLLLGEPEFVEVSDADDDELKNI